MQMVALSASARTKEVSAKNLRRTGVVPAVVYGNTEHLQVECKENILKKAYAQAGESTLVELDVDGNKLPVLFHAIDFDPVSDRITHVDFYAVDMKKEIEADIPVRFEGESLAVKDAGAIIVTAMDTVSVRCLPSDLPHDLPVSLEKLTEFGSTITVADITAPKGVTILAEPDQVLAIAQEPRAEEVVEVAAPAEGEAAAAGAEGAAAPTEGEKAEGGADGGKKKGDE
jgi:large subunit ribosomal protein L25